MFSKSLRAAFVALTVLAVSISATQSLSVKVTGMFQISSYMLYIIHFLFRSRHRRFRRTP